MNAPIHVNRVWFVKLDKILQSQGFGSRRECDFLIKKGFVTVHGEQCKNPKQDFSTEGLVFGVNDDEFEYYEKIYIALNKPEGYECSHHPEYHQSIYELLPEQFMLRGVQSVGRLDQDTTGLLLLSDDGAFIQALTHPKKHVGKEYWVTTVDPVEQKALDALRKGVELRREPGVFKATDVKQTDEYELEMTVHQGVYHQVKRMIAAVGNKVAQLHRQRVGQLELPKELNAGEWCFLTAEEVEQAKARSTAEM